MSERMRQSCSLLPHHGVVEYPVERERIAPQGLGDVALAAAAQQVECQMAQAGEDAGVAANAADILGQGGTEHMMQPVFNCPVLAHEVGKFMGYPFSSTRLTMDRCLRSIL